VGSNDTLLCCYYIYGDNIIMKKPEKISDAKVCIDCQVEWKKDIKIHAVEKEFQQSKYFTWANEDGTTHTLPAQYNFIHVWNNLEVQIGKDSGSAGLRANRENIGGDNTQDLIKKDLLDEPKVVELQPNEPKETGHIPPKVKEMDAADFAETSMKAEVKIECKFIKIIEDVVFDFLGTKEAPVPNPNHVGMYVKLIRDQMNNKWLVKRNESP